MKTGLNTRAKRSKPESYLKCRYPPRSRQQACNYGVSDSHCRARRTLQRDTSLRCIKLNYNWALTTAPYLSVRLFTKPHFIPLDREPESISRRNIKFECLNEILRLKPESFGREIYESKKQVPEKSGWLISSKGKLTVTAIQHRESVAGHSNYNFYLIKGK